VLNNTSSDVESLGGKPWAKIPKYCKEAFMHQIGISIPQKFRNNEGLGVAVANHIKAQQYKDDTLKSISKKTPAAPTKPPLLKSGGTMYSVNNTIMVLMQCYMNTKQRNDREDQDLRNPNATDWEMMQK
jgi:hypothetical protein